MASEYLVFQSREGLAVGIFIIIFAIANYILNKFMRNRAVALVVSFLISLIAGWQLYKREFYGFEGVLAFLLIVIAIVVFGGIILKFLKGANKTFGR